MITANQLNKVLAAQSESIDDAKKLGAEYTEIGIDAEYAYFKVFIKNAQGSAQATQAIDQIKHKTRFQIVQEKWVGRHYLAECKIAA